MKLDGRHFGDGYYLKAQFAQIEECLPVQRGNVSLSNLRVLNAILYVAEHGCKWRGLPKRFGNWHTIYTRMNRWSKSGVLDRVFERLQRSQIVRIIIEVVLLDSTIVKVHPDGTGALKTAPKPSASPEEDGTTKIHLVAADARTAITFALSPGAGGRRPRAPGPAHPAGAPNRPLHLIMDRAYEGNETRQLALDLQAFIPVVPPLCTLRLSLAVLRDDKRRNEAENSSQAQGLPADPSCFDKLDRMFTGLISFALIADGLRLC